MNWLSIYKVSSNNWSSKATEDIVKSINQKIDSLIQSQDELNKEESDLLAIPAEELTPKILASGSKLKEKRLNLLLEELPLRKQIITYYQQNEQDFKSWKSKQPTPSQVEAENAEFLVANGWQSPDDPEVKSGRVIGYVGHFTVACRIKSNWRQARLIEMKSYTVDGLVSKEQEAITQIEGMMSALKVSAVTL